MTVQIVAHFLNSLLMIAIPISLAIILTLHWKLDWRFCFIGAGTFILSQIGHILFLWISTLILNRSPLANYFVNAPKYESVIFNGIFLGLAAGLFEEFFRYGMYRWWAKDARSWRTGILTGIGHGGAEAVILGIFALYSFFQLVAYRNIDLSTIFPSSQLELANAQVSSYWHIPWYESLMPAFERFAAIIIQISMAVLVLQVFIRKRRFWLWLAVLYHAMIDFLTVPAAAGYISKYATEAIIGGFGILSLIIIYLLRQSEHLVGLENSPVSTLDFKPTPVAETDENLDKTRFL